MGATSLWCVMGTCDPAAWTRAECHGTRAFGRCPYDRGPDGTGAAHDDSRARPAETSSTDMSHNPRDLAMMTFMTSLVPA